MTRPVRLALALLLAAATPVFSGEAHDHKGKHGGKVVHSGHHNLEIVVADGALEVHVTHEDGTPQDVKNAKATAVVLSEGKKQDVTLTPGGTNVLKGTGEFKAPKGTTVVVTLTMPDHEPEQVRVEVD